MRLLFCDDDVYSLCILTKYVREYFEKHGLKTPEIVTFRKGEDLLLDQGDKDIVFLEIEMPGLSGIHVGKTLKELNQNIIIFVVTAYAEYLDEAMRFHVFRYLSKPIDKQRLFRNLKDALSLYCSSVFKVPVETKESLFSIYAQDIVCIEAQNRKNIVHTVEGDYYSVHNIQYWEQLLPTSTFFRTHRSFLINMKYVTDFDRSLIHLHKHPFRAYLARRKFAMFRQAYLLYLESIQ